MTDDDALIARAGEGDPSAFRSLYQKHRNDVARLVFRMVGPRGDHEDLVQEVFFQVYKSLKDFRGQSKFSTWLHRVTVNVVLMARRAQKSRPVFSATAEGWQDDVRDPQALPDADAERGQRVRAFSAVLNRLGEKKRDVFILHELEGHSPSEIAEMVGCPVLTVRTRLFYARREIEAMLREEPALRGAAGTFSRAAQGDSR
jgi:RNA polymerase sigma-70 factor (ECF subfamily)